MNPVRISSSAASPSLIQGRQKAARWKVMVCKMIIFYGQLRCSTVDRWTTLLQHHSQCFNVFFSFSLRCSKPFFQYYAANLLKNYIKRFLSKNFIIKISLLFVPKSNWWVFFKGFKLKWIAYCLTKKNMYKVCENILYTQFVNDWRKY